MKNLIAALKNYDKEYEARRNEYADKVKNLERVYGTNGEYYKTTKAALDSEYDTANAEAKAELKKQIGEAIGKMKSKVEAFVAAPIPAAILPSLQAIKAAGVTVSDSEAKILLESCKGSYFARKLVLSLIGKNSMLAAHYEDYETFKKDFETLESDIAAWLDGYDPDTYSHAVMISEESSPILDIEKRVEAFIA